jgi:hypothetical protein
MFRSFRPGFAAISAFIVLTALLGRAQGSNQASKGTVDVSGTWTAELHSAKVFLQVRTSAPDGSTSWNGDWSSGQSFAIEEIAGLPANEEHSTASNFKFDLRREAGTIACEGAFRDGRGAGLFGFTPRAEYANELKALGYTDDLPLWRRFQLALHDVGPKYVKALASEGYATLSLDEVQRARTHGVTIEYIRDMKALGYRTPAIDGLVRAHAMACRLITSSR